MIVIINIYIIDKNRNFYYLYQQTCKIPNAATKKPSQHIPSNSASTVPCDPPRKKLKLKQRGLLKEKLLLPQLSLKLRRDGFIIMGISFKPLVVHQLW